MKLIVKTHFDSAHYLENYKGKCSNLHGHRWEVEAHIIVADDENIVLDFGDAKKLINSVLPDHKCLNDVYDFNPTAENIVTHLKAELSKIMDIEKLIVWETPECGAEC